MRSVTIKIVSGSLPNTEQDNKDEKEVKINVYVDDGQLSNTTEESIKESFRILKLYENTSGAKVHKTKTTAIWAMENQETRI